MRLRLVGDHAAEHCGCQAVTTALTAALVAAPGGACRLVGPDDDYDGLVVNGEGSMHHGRRNWLLKMDAIRMAQAAGKRSWLVNSLWDSNPGSYDDCLAALDGFWVRGPASARDLAARHGLIVPHRIDVSFDCPIDEDGPPDALARALRDRIAVTDLYVPGYDFVWLPENEGHGRRDPWVRVDMRRVSWSSLVRALRQAQVLIAGRHHGIYAACKARLPFVAIRGNAHKVEDLLQGARSPIPIAERRSEVEALLVWARSNRAAYDDLFDWMEAQPPWQFDPDAAGQAPRRVPGWPGHRMDPTAAPIQPPETRPETGSAHPAAALSDADLLARAMAAFERRDHAGAYPFWRELLARRGAALPYPRNACLVFFGAGDVPLALQVLARTRGQKPASVILAKTLMGWARDPTIWLDRSTAPGWWSDLKEAAHLARCNDPAAPAMAAAAVAGAEADGAELDGSSRVQGPLLAASVRFLLACKLVQLNRHPAAFALYQTCPVTGLPDGIDHQERVLLNALCRRFDAASTADLAAAPQLACWADPAFRAVVLRHRLMTEPPATGTAGEKDSGILADIIAAARQFPQHPELRDLLYSTAAEAGDWSFLGPAPTGPGSFGLPALQAAADRHLGVAALLHQWPDKTRPDKARPDTRPDIRDAIADRAALLAAFEQGRGRLMALLADPALRLAVVGNSPVALGQGQGPQIDSHDLVLRFNQFSTAPRFVADYGQRTDIHVQTYPLTFRAGNDSTRRDCLIVQRHAFTLFEPRDWTPVLAAHADGQALAYLGREVFARAALHLGCSPSAGFTLAYLIRSLRGALNRVDFFGFSMVDQLQGARKAHYFNDEAPSLLHDWQREAQAFDALF